MPEPELPAPLRHQVLVDPTGRRRRRLAIAGRLTTIALGLWLLVLALGGLGLQPLAGLPVLGAGEAAPPALPKRIKAAVDRGATVAPASSAQSAVPTAGKGKTSTTAGKGKTSTTPGNGNTASTPASSGSASPSATAPGQARTPPGQTKTGPGPPATTPGNGKGNIKSP